MNIKPALRISNVEEYYFSSKLREIAALNAAGKNIMNLGIGNPDLPPHCDVIKILCAEAEKKNTHGYQSYKGIEELRTAFAQWYKKWFQVDLDPATEILPLLGSKEGILHVSMAFLNLGDGVLIPNPGYPTYQSVSKLLGADIINYDLHETTGWYPNFDELENKDLSKVKLMWVNYPQMPTGTPATIELFEKLVAFGRKHEILICNDNPYSFIHNEKQLSILQVDRAKECCLEMNSLSKSHNMAGWRMGMLAGNNFYIDCVLRVKSNIDSGMFKPLQLAAAAALNLDENWYAQIDTIYKRRRRRVCEIMDLLGCTYSHKQVGMFLWGKIPSSINDEKELVDKVLYEAGVFITPGSIFGSGGKGYIRISLSSDDPVIEEAYLRLCKLTNKK